MMWHCRLPRGGDRPGFTAEDVENHTKFTRDVLSVIGAREDRKTNPGIQRVRAPDEAFALYVLQLAIEHRHALDERQGHNGKATLSKVFEYFQRVTKTREDKRGLDEAVEKGLKDHRWGSGGAGAESEEEDSDEEGEGDATSARARILAEMFG